MKIIFSFLFFLFTISSYSQPNKSKVIYALQNADSIILISHKLTQEYAPVIVSDDPKKRQGQLYQSFLLKGNINPSIILRRVFLNKMQTKDLIQIFLSSAGKGEWTPAMCDMPHNSILIYKNSRFSYIDICFDCSRIHASKDLRFTKYAEIDMSPARWKLLEAFFKKFKVNYISID